MFVCHACQIDVFFSAASRKKDIILASMINKYSTYFVTALARFFSSKPRRPKSLLCGRKFHLQRAQEALSVEHLVASTDIFYGSFPEVAPDVRRHRSFSKIPVQYLILKEAHNGWFFVRHSDLCLFRNKYWGNIKSSQKEYRGTSYFCTYVK